MILLNEILDMTKYDTLKWYFISQFPWKQREWPGLSEVMAGI